MRAGIAASAIIHTGVITLALVGLNAAQPLEPQQIESIAIELVPVEEFSNIRAGSLDSEIIETETPSAVDTPDPAELAERTGNTEEDQPNPEQTDTPTPAPTIQTAPQPEAVEAPEPEPEDVAPEPAPEPEPEAAPEPVLTTAPTEADTPAEIAPQPVIKTASIDQKRAEFKKNQEEEAKRRAAEREAQQAKTEEATKIDDIINAEESRGATTGSGGQATAGKPTGQAARLTQAEQAALAGQMRKCFSPPLGATTEDAARLLVDLNRDGSVSGTPRITATANTRLGETTARAAQRAVIRCGPYQLAAEKYDEWRQVDVTFDPRDL